MTQLYRLTLFLLVILAASSVTLWAQGVVDRPISGEFTNLKFDAFVQQIEAKTPFRFYYNPTEVDSLVVNIQVSNQPVRSVLQQIFNGTKYSYAIDNQQRIYVTIDRVIRTDLPVGFFQGGAGSGTDSTLNAYLTENQRKQSVEPEAKTYEIGKRTNPIRPGRSTLAGYVRNTSSGEPIVGAAVYIENPRLGTVSDQFGYYSITLPRGRHDLKLRSIGLKDTRRRIILYSDGKFDIDMDDDVIALKEVVIEAEKDKNISGVQMGQERVDIKSIKQVPSAISLGTIPSRYRAAVTI